MAALGTVATDHSRSLRAGGDQLRDALTGGYHLAYVVGAAFVALGILAAFAVMRGRIGGQPQEVGGGELPELEPIREPSAQLA